MGQASYRRLRQICLVARDFERARADFSALFNVSGCYRDPKVAMFGLENILFSFGGCFIEIVAPTQPETAAGRFMARSTPHGAYMSIFDCDDLAAARQRVVDAGIRIIFNGEEENGSGIQLHPSDVGCGILEIDQHLGGADLLGRYTWAGHDWQRHALAPEQGSVRGIVMVSSAAESRAALWSKLIGCDIERAQDARWHLKLDWGEATFVGIDPGQAERIATVVMRVPNVARTLAVARERGLQTDAGSFKLLETEFRLEAIENREPNCL